MIEKYLPSKKFQTIFAIGLLVIVGLFFLSHWYNGRSTSYKAEKGDSLQKTSLDELAGKDSNANGIPDWEESLWGLDPEGDGAKNKAVIDSHKQALEQPSGTDVTADGDLNETQAFSRAFFTAVASLKESGGLTSDNISKLAENLSTNISQSKTIEPAHTLSEIKTVDNANPAAIKKYYDALQKVVLAQGNKRLGEEMVVVESGLNGTTNTMYADLTFIAKGYKEFGDGLFAISPVPTEVAQAHLDAVNALLALSVISTNMSQVLDNPLIGMIGVAQYSGYRDAMENAFAELGRYFRGNGIMTNVPQTQ